MKYSSCGRGEKKQNSEIHVPMATLFLSCDGVYVREKNFEKILSLYIFFPPLTVKVRWDIDRKINH